MTKTKEIDRYKIAVAENGSDLDIFLLNQAGLRAKTRVNRSTRNVTFSDASGIPAPTSSSAIEDGAVDLTKFFSRGALAGHSDPSTVILDAAYLFVQNNDAPHFDEGAVETDEWDIVLKARSDVPVADPAMPGNSPGSSGRSGRGPLKPRRRKGRLNIWI